MATDMIALQDKLIGLMKLEADWDGDGAKPIPPETVARARDHLLTMSETGGSLPDGAYASPRGTILLTWHNGPNYFELEVISSVREEWLAVIPQAPNRFGRQYDREAEQSLNAAMSPF